MAADVESMTRARPASIGGRYRIVEQLGAGGMGVVYRALDRLSGDHVALKSVTAAVEQLDFAHGAPDGLTIAEARHDLGASMDDKTVVLDPEETLASPRGTAPSPTPAPSKMRALANEFKTLASLRHPNIISVLDYGFDRDRSPFYTMELLEDSQTLLEAARQRNFDDKMKMLVEVLRALSYLHRRDIVHRDLKPGNVMVHGEVKVLDFGLAVRVGHDKDSGGTLTHVAPEVLKGKRATAAADLYAVGILAYEMLAGRHPFSRRQRSRLMRDHLSREPDLDCLGVGDQLKDVIRRLLSKRPRERWQNAEEVIRALTTAAEVDLPTETVKTRESFLQTAEFVDRYHERAELVRALQGAVRDGRGGIWLIEGESGIGKSRLLDEIRTEALVLGAAVAQGHASPHRGAHHIWRGPLQLLTLNTPLSDDEGGVLQVLLPDLGQLLERTLPEVELTPQTAREEMLGAIRSVLARQKWPTLLLLEDLHWAPDCVEVLQGLSAELSNVPLVVVATYRGEEAVDLAETLANNQTMHLEPLATGDISDLTRSMIGPQGDQRELLDFLEENTGGNAFFIVETVRALAEEAGGLGRVASSQLPRTVQASGIDDVVQRRLSLVPTEHRGFVRLAAALGRELDVRLLERLTGVEQTSSGLRVLEELALLEIRENVWRFSHDRFRQALLEEIADDERRQHHRSIAEAIEELYGATDDTATTLAHHFGRAGDLDRETGYSAQAGAAALARGAYRDAIELLARAVDNWPALSDPDPEAELDVLLRYGSVLIAARGWSAPEVKATYDRAVDLARELGRELQVAPALIGLAKFHYLLCELSRTRSLSEQCLELADSSGDPIVRQHALLMLGEAGVWVGEFWKDPDYPEKIARLHDPKQAPLHISLFGQDSLVTSMVSSSWGTWMLGLPEKALETSREAMALARQDDNPFSLAIAHQLCSWLHQLRREPRETVLHAGQLAELSQEHGFVAFEAMASMLHAWGMAQLAHQRGIGSPNQGTKTAGTKVYYLDADPDATLEAAIRETSPQAEVERIRAGLEQWHGIGAQLGTTFYVALLSDACRVAGDAETGLAAIDGALAPESPLEERCYLSELHRLRGELLLQKSAAPSAIEASLRTALEIAGEQRARSFQLRAATSLASFYQRRDRPEEARKVLGEIYQSLVGHGATHDLRAASSLLTTLDTEA